MNPKKVDMPTMSIDKYKDMKVMNKKFLTIREGVELYSMGHENFRKIPSSSIVALAKALHTTPNYLLMGEAEEDPWMEDVMQVLSEIKDPAMRKLAIDQLKCIARIS